MSNLFPLATFDVIDDARADAALVAWGHYLGECARPFGRQSFGLEVSGELVSVAVSASTVGSTCGGFGRMQVVELARLVTSPTERWATRVCLRLWRELAPRSWAIYWPVVAVVSYSDATRHKGDVYRFDGWTKVAEVPGSSGGGTYSSRKKATPKSVWVYELAAAKESAA
jgi:hypothetical protein